APLGARHTILGGRERFSTCNVQAQNKAETSVKPQPLGLLNTTPKTYTKGIGYTYKVSSLYAWLERPACAPQPAASVLWPSVCRHSPLWFSRARVYQHRLTRAAPACQASPSPHGLPEVLTTRAWERPTHIKASGKGSGQQSVTGVTSVDDGNSYWRIRGQTYTVCERGAKVKCGQSIRLMHVNTGRNLHSHHFSSPLSGNQEVSAFGDDGEGDILDDWTVLCNGEFWQRDEEVRFRHASTSALLSVTGEQYGRPINGQREVHGMSYTSLNNYWKAMEGIFMKPSDAPRTDFTHSEL
uniref:Stromal cell derived factor 2 n=1 Tax=Leptobrachium leishanense TaxID=445787 RepID=A0A8C5MX38_9ANUR